MAKKDEKDDSQTAAEKANDSKKPQHAPDNYRIAIDGEAVGLRALDALVLADGSEVGPGDTFEASKQYAHDLVRHGRAQFTDDEDESVEEKDENTGEIKTIRRKKTRGK